ncbi:MAG: hypothetical protein ACK4IY_09120 [Chitinophagales bacterium]
MTKGIFTYRNLLSLLGIAFAIWFVWNFYVIIAYFLIAAIVSLLGQPIVSLLDKIKFGKFFLPRWLAALFSLSAIIIVIIGVLMLFVPLIIEQAEIITSIDTEKVAASLEAPLQRIENLVL